MAAVSWALWPVSLPAAQLGDAPSSAWWAASNGLAPVWGERVSSKLLKSSKSLFKAFSVGQAAVWFLKPGGE